jgi:hypothetical protein
MSFPKAIWIDPLNRGARWVEQQDAQPNVGDAKYVLADLETNVPIIADFLSEVDSDKLPMHFYTGKARTLLRELGYV